MRVIQFSRLKVTTDLIVFSSSLFKDDAVTGKGKNMPYDDLSL